jgi:hypothetical protein
MTQRRQRLDATPREENLNLFFIIEMTLTGVHSSYNTEKGI